LGLGALVFALARRRGGAVSVDAAD
jgi:hypothetical protein